VVCKSISKLGTIYNLICLLLLVLFSQEFFLGVFIIFSVKIKLTLNYQANLLSTPYDQ
jgi:hypothetical protein